MQSEFLLFLSLTSLLAGCVSSSVQLNDEYLFWKKWRKTYWHTSRTEWGHWLSYRYNVKSVGLPQKPLGFTPISWVYLWLCDVKGVKLHIKQFIQHTCLESSVSPSCQLSYQDISGVKFQKPLPDKIANSWHGSVMNVVSETSVIFILLFTKLTSMIWKTTYNRVNFDFIYH
jgi:hypothetical protein